MWPVSYRLFWAHSLRARRWFQVHLHVACLFASRHRCTNADTGSWWLDSHCCLCIALHTVQASLSAEVWVRRFDVSALCWMLRQEEMLFFLNGFSCVTHPICEIWMWASFRIQGPEVEFQFHFPLIFTSLGDFISNHDFVFCPCIPEISKGTLSMWLRPQDAGAR